MRLRFLKEELQETENAYVDGDLAKFFDGLIDLVYVALGTAHIAGLPWQAGWDAVQKANMAKRRVELDEDSPRGHHTDVVKPKGWTPPDIEQLVMRAQLGHMECGADNFGRRCTLHYTHRGHLHTDGMVTWVASPIGHVDAVFPVES